MNHNPKPRKSEANSPHHKKLVAILKEEQDKRGMSGNEFLRFLGFNCPRGNPNLQHWKTKRSTPNFRLILQMWRILGRSLDKDFL